MTAKKWSRAEMAARVARDIPDGSVVNLGIGLPTQVANHLPPGREIVPLGGLDPEAVITPGIFVRRIVLIDRVATSAGGFRQQA